MTKLYIGTSGWSYIDWVGIFYKSPERLLSQYCRYFKTVEMDSSFYTIPSIEVMNGIARTIPHGFKMSLKMPRYITHESLLGKKGKFDDILKQFYRNIEPILRRGSAAAILIQLPPKFGYDPVTLENFLSILDDRYRYAVEFREPSWLKPETYKLLERYNAAYTIVDEPLLPPEAIVTTDIAYIRWHGRGRRPWYNYRYTDHELREWIPKIEAIMDQVDHIYGYFNNHFHGYAVENALQILDMFGLLDEKGREELEKIKNRLDKPYIKKRMLKMDEYLIDTLDLKGILELLTDKKRLERGLRISDKELHFTRADPDQIVADIRNYKVIIDSQERMIIHNCGDWQRLHMEKKLCKHLVKIIVAIPRDDALNIVRDLAKNIDLWSFEYLETPTT